MEALLRQKERKTVEKEVMGENGQDSEMARVFEMGNFVGKENAQVGWAFNCGWANYAAMSQWGKALA